LSDLNTHLNLNLYDVAVIGAGPVGMATALALHQAGFSVVMVDNRPEYTQRQGLDPSKWFALGPDVLGWFQDLGFVLKYQPITQLKLSCQGQDPPIVLDSYEANEPFLTGVVHSQDLSAQGHALCQNIPVFSLDYVVQWCQNPSFWHLQLASGACMRALLVVGADGGQSGVRAFFDPVVVRADFRQKAVVFLLESVPKGWSYEHFFPQGSLAVLSLLDGKGAGIWIGPEKDSIGLDISGVVEDMLGISSPTTGRVSVFDVHGHWVGQKIFNRCVLIGDAAHAMHPIAGQGLNVGLRNARMLVDQIVHRRSLGLDWGLGLDALRHRWGMPTLSMQLGTSFLVSALCGNAPKVWWKVGARVMQFSWARNWLVHTAAGKIIPKNPFIY